MTQIISKINLFKTTLCILLYALSHTSYSNQVIVDEPLTKNLELIRVKYNLPALAAMQIKYGVASGAATGYREQGNQSKVTIHDSFHLGSCTKAMTATLIGMYIDKGKLRFNSTLEELFPEYEIDDQLKAVTVEMLLSHMSGISGKFRIFFNKIANTSPNIIKQRALITKEILKSKPEYSPGTKFNYSNNGYIILGHILERITSYPWEQIIATDLFKPLDMSACSFGPAKNQTLGYPTQPWPHKYSISGPVPVFPGNTDQADNPPALGPAGTVSCSLEDWSKFASLHLDSSKQKLLDKNTMDKLHTTYPGQSYTYGGWGKHEEAWAKGYVLTHTGSNTMNFVQVWIATNINCIILVATNYAGSEADDFSIASRAVNEVLKIFISS